MAHFAQLDDSNLVTQIIVVNNQEILDANGNESESLGVAFCKNLFGEDTTWVQTSYNGNFRKRYAGIGYTYDAARDAFIEPQPFPSWTLDEETCGWNAPVPYPGDPLDFANFHVWDEENQEWVRPSI